MCKICGSVLLTWGPPHFGCCYSSSKNQLRFLRCRSSGLSIPHAIRSPHGSQSSSPSHPSLEALENLFQYSVCNLQESRLWGCSWEDPVCRNMLCCHYHPAAAPRFCYKEGPRFFIFFKSPFKIYVSIYPADRDIAVMLLGQQIFLRAAVIVKIFNYTQRAQAEINQYGSSPVL